MKTIIAASLLVLFSCAVLLAQAQRSSQPPSSRATQALPAQPADQSAPQGLAGRIERKSGRYVLRESASKAEFLLDDQKAAKKYNGRIVFVTGIVDLAAKTIHVERIEVAA